MRPRRSLSSRSAAGNRAEATESAMEVTGLKSMSSWRGHGAAVGAFVEAGPPVSRESGRGTGPLEKRLVPGHGRRGALGRGLCVQHVPHPSASRRHFPWLGVGDGDRPHGGRSLALGKVGRGGGRCSGPVTAGGRGGPRERALRRVRGSPGRGCGASPPPPPGTGFGGRHFHSSPSSPRFSF